MDSSEFEKYFNVYASDKIIGMQILTADIMEDILEFKNLTKQHFDIFINNNNIYLRFHCGSMFEIRTLKSGPIDEQNLKKYYDILNFADNLSRKIIKIINETEL